MRRFLLPFATALALAAPGAQAFCGFYAGKADASLFNEASQVVVARDGQRTTLSLLNDYKGPLNEFALVVPTPTVIRQGQVRIAEKATFERLDGYSAPRLAEYHDSDPCRLDWRWGWQPPPPMAAMSRAAPAAARPRSARDEALGVRVEAQYTLEEYDIVSLSAEQSDGLETWLRENGYRIPAGASAALRPYIQQGMKFFVAKVNLQAQAQTGYTMLRPLQFSFQSEKFMLPMRLGMLNAPPGKPQDLIVYLLTREGRVESSNYRTVPLPANMNLPSFVKPRFAEFYRAMFDEQARQAEHRVVFTEYFWDMAWCDPCAAQPLTAEELHKAGATWAAGVSQAQPVVLTRLHVRYTPETFPEDLMFTQTRDRQNWQARYVIQNPHQGSVAQCDAKLAQADCEAMCKPRVETVLRYQGSPWARNQPDLPRSTDPQVLTRDCAAACQAAKRDGVARAARYYERDLPARIAAEKQTLARLTGWSLAQIDAMPDARKFTEAAARVQAPWWRRLFVTETP
ncbi:DUF2330 domain-containing protein [Ramlibacter sp.]|uniref:DUF2330 domain-containing protein n=1 Tax=Ramlibacter sp. TaxID=1917967 RepID=UPI0035B3178C